MFTIHGLTGTMRGVSTTLPSARSMAKSIMLEENRTYLVIKHNGKIVETITNRKDTIK